MSTSTIEKQNRAKTTTETVNLRVTAKVSRIMESHGTTPEKLVNEIWQAISHPESIAEILEVIHPHTGKKGTINGLFMVGGPEN